MKQSRQIHAAKFYAQQNQGVAFNLIKGQIVSEFWNVKGADTIRFRVAPHPAEFGMFLQESGQPADFIFKPPGDGRAGMLMELTDEFREVGLENRTEDELHAAAARALAASLRRRCTLPARNPPASASSTQF